MPYDMPHSVASINYSSYTPTIIQTIFSYWRIVVVHWPFRVYGQIQKVCVFGFLMRFLIASQNSLCTIPFIVVEYFSDAESHILFFDIEGLIFELHSEEYAAMSPTTLEVNDFYCRTIELLAHSLIALLWGCIVFDFVSGTRIDYSCAWIHTT